MASVPKRIADGYLSGAKLTEVLAHHSTVSHELQRQARMAGTRASVMLAGHRQDGNARIGVEKGDLDWYVFLDDERGLQAAMTIEYGRKDRPMGTPGYGIRDKGGMVGLFILHRAWGMGLGQ